MACQKIKLLLLLLFLFSPPLGIEHVLQVVEEEEEEKARQLKRVLPVINVFALWHCSPLLASLLCVLELQQNIIIPLRMVGLLLRSGCASAASRPFLNFSWEPKR